jgi:hypothetical protein
MAVVCLMKVTLLLLLFLALNPSAEAKGAVAMLTHKLGRAQLRNEHIYSTLWKEMPDMFDMVIFYQGSSKEEREALQGRTPNMPLIYIDVTAHFDDFLQTIPQYLQNNEWQDNPVCPNNRGASAFGFGYKLMCLFWFKSFVFYLPKEYDWMLRVDDDVQIVSGFPLPLTFRYDRKSPVKVAATSWLPFNTTVERSMVGAAAVQQGMNRFARSFMEEKHLLSNPHFTDAGNVYLAPYTNVLYVDMNWIRTHALVREYQYRVEQSTCIMVNRWGDLELWGYIVGIARVQPYLLPISYIHHSHHCLSTNKHVVSGGNHTYVLPECSSPNPTAGGGVRLKNHNEELPVAFK